MIQILRLALLGGALAAPPVQRSGRSSVRPPRHQLALPHSRRGDVAGTPGVANTTELWFANRIDHLTSDIPPGGNYTYAQRFFVNGDHWTSGGPIFFYCGNEADVTLYVNSTGLMWERAADFGALLVWGEHRYYGQSQPLGSLEASAADKRFLSVEQALADFAALVSHIKHELLESPDSAVVGFGGSYGGMLASWMRFKYPHIIDGAIAASAPIWSFEGESPLCDPNFYAEGVTYDVSTAGGAASPWCEDNFRAAFASERLAYAGATPEGRAALEEGFKLCAPLEGDASGWDVTYWVNTALSYMAMGNYPYPSSYILNGDGMLPAFPVIAGCDAFLSEDLTATCGNDPWDLCPPLYQGLSAFAGIYYNNSGDLTCNNLNVAVNPESALVDELWGYQYCTEIFQLFGQEPGPDDVFWPAPWNATEAAAGCEASNGGRAPNAGWATLTFGEAPSQWAAATSNIVWSNGELDPWAGGGVKANLSTSLVSITIPQAAHHLDLMFSDDGDTVAVTEARDFEMAHVRRWIEEKKARWGP